MRFSLSHTTLLCIAAAFTTDLAAQGGLPKESPFAPSSGARAVAVPDETIEFAGISSIGTKTDLIFYDKVAKKSRWIALGETMDGISAHAYDEQHEQAVVTINGTRKILPLRKPRLPKGGTSPAQAMHPTLAVAAPPPVLTLPAGTEPPPAGTQAAPTIPSTAEPALTLVPDAATAGTPPMPADSTPAGQARAEVEARMLVSDLLEIGIAQRRAYEEAQRKAAGPREAGAQPDAPQQFTPPPTAPESAPAPN
jgi:hypothetical protein